ncbi:HWE histidine kinase domain-containing protein [Roseomonas sp. BN140053]|uniref:HWE histidine kinase domain-containing protein n=1 Tax=Roseomonas sp. BN140053 TaxID=3391898 RepID=UPI0039E7D9ED
MSDDTLPDSHLADLATCEREPIHIPGSIQPHGLLLVLDPAGERVLQLAGNTAGLLDRAPEAVLDGPAEAVLGAELLSALREAAATGGGLDGQAQVFPAVELAPGRRFDLQARRSPAGLIMELEPLAVPGPGFRPQALSLVQAMMARLQGFSSLTEFCQAATTELRAATGFDRVMAYQFLPDESGTVIAEAKAADIDSYMGQHFPASDIPRQARALYLRQWLRLIPDAEYRPSPLRPALNPLTGQPLDMSDCALRSVSPVHLEYLRNMGVRASMSLSIIRGGKLWGLFACHHRAPWHLAPMLRTACALFAQMFSFQLEAIEQRADHDYALHMQRVHEQLVQVMAREEQLGDGLIRNRPSLKDYVDSEGVALLIDGRYASAGVTPDEAEVRALAAWLAETAGDGVTALDRLPEVYEPARNFAEVASGVLALSVSRAPHDVILWFRPEAVRTVTWAGNPDKPVEPGGDGARLSPRHSFAAWQETVRGRSRPWKPVEVEAAQALHVSLLEVVLRRIDEVSRERSQAREQQDLLMAELDHRVKNTLANIQALVRHTRSGAGSLEGFVHDFDRRIRAMAVAHSLLTNTRWEGADLRSLVEEELRPYRAAGAERAFVRGPALRLKPKAALAVSLALHELATNAAKYGALSSPAGQVSVSWGVRGENVLLDWVESGGPPVSPPKRRGFGSTVVERGLSYELGGTSEMNFDPAGLRCVVTIPLNQMVEATSSAPVPEPAPPPPPARFSLAGLRILVAEDAALVAMELVDALTGREATVEGPAATLAQAVRLAVSKPLDGALLDVDLNGEQVFSVADVLTERGVPFLFTTGYEANTILPERFRDAAVLNKPYGGEDAADALAALIGASRQT